MDTPSYQTLFAKQSASPSAVTVCVSLFNYEQYIVEALDSVRRQTLSDLDLVVVDDCSTDDSAGVALEWATASAERFGKLKLVRHERNEGPSAVRNTGFLLSETDFVFVLDADDMLYPRCISRCLQAIETSNAQFAYPMLELFEAIADLWNTDPWDPERFKGGNYIAVSALVDRSAWSRVGGFSPVQLGCEDFDFWCKFVEHGFSGVLVPEILARYRIHYDSRTHTQSNPNIQQVFTEMQQRHPWLSLPFSSPY